MTNNKKKKKRKNKEHSIESVISNNEKFETNKLFLKAVLAEYDKLNNEVVTHQRNLILLLSILIGGIATMLGVFGIIGAMSLILVPILVSVCVLLILAEEYQLAFIGEYIKEEIEGRKLGKLFPHDLPIQWEEHFQSQHARYNMLFCWGIFVVSDIISTGCLVLVTIVFYNDLSSNVVYQLAYYLAWMIVIFYSILGSAILSRFNFIVKNSEIS